MLLVTLFMREKLIGDLEDRNGTEDFRQHTATLLTGLFISLSQSSSQACSFFTSRDPPKLQTFAPNVYFCPEKFQPLMTLIIPRQEAIKTNINIILLLTPITLLFLMTLSANKLLFHTVNLSLLHFFNQQIYSLPCSKDS